MRRFPVWGYIGLILVIVFWYINWGFSGIRTHFGFFPLWLGYCLTMDAITYTRKGNSLFSRNNKYYVLLFIISAPCWWLFEILSERGQYWHYTAREHFTNLEFFVFATISFSTVIPAVFGTGELLGTLKWIKTLKPFLRIGNKTWHLFTMFTLGLTMLMIVIFLPAYGAPFLWMSIYFIIDPLNVWLGNRSILNETAKGNWRSVVALLLGCILCGFFWEMWNFYSSPKWIYNVPGVNFWHIFEMPALGYLGYIPFALELFALYHFIVGIFGDRIKNYVQIVN